MLTPEAMRRLEERAGTELGLGPEVLMEHAGRAVADAVLASGARRIGVLAGPGQNGGDAFVAARLLAAGGCTVNVLWTGRQKEEGAARLNLARLQKMDGIVWDDGPPWTPGILDLLVDGIFGTGLARAPAGHYRALIERAASLGVPSIAIDVPSGLDATTGEVPGAVLPAVTTVTFVAARTGHLIGAGPDVTGHLVIDPISLPPSLLDGPLTWVDSPSGLLPRLGRRDDKVARGRVLIVAGSLGMAGAAGLAALGALGAAAGLVTLAVPEEIEGRYLALCPEAKTLPLPEDVGKAAGLVEEALQSADAAVFGPGLGRGDRTRRLVEVALHQSGRLYVVIDADALWALSPLAGELPGRTVLTPHEGEFHRLFPDASGPSFEQARWAAGRSGALVVLKGPASVVAHPDGRSAIVTGASRVLAQGGSGDVLSGMLAAVLARTKGDPLDSVAGTVAWHGRASQVLASEFGPGAGARRLAAILPRALEGDRP